MLCRHELIHAIERDLFFFTQIINKVIDLNINNYREFSQQPKRTFCLALRLKTYNWMFYKFHCDNGIYGRLIDYSYITTIKLKVILENASESHSKLNEIQCDT